MGCLKLGLWTIARIGHMCIVVENVYCACFAPHRKSQSLGAPRPDIASSERRNMSNTQCWQDCKLGRNSNAPFLNTPVTDCDRNGVYGGGWRGSPIGNVHMQNLMLIYNVWPMCTYVSTHEFPCCYFRDFENELFLI